MSNPYNYHSSHTEYYFKTVANVQYKAYFTEWAAGFEDYPEVAGEVRQFGFQVIDKPVGQIPTDARVGDTIGAIIKSFFEQNAEGVLIVLLDNSDQKHNARKRRFEEWFRKEKGWILEKIDGSTGKAPYNSFISLLFRSDHPNRALIHDAAAFFQLKENAKP